MPYEDALRDSLKSLYNEASGFKVSIDIIVKLAKSLKLDTFVDTDETPGVKRLSIAGSLLLLDIDFKNDTEVVKVSLSSGNHSSDSVSEAEFSSQIEENVSAESENGNNGQSGAAKSVILPFEHHLTASFLRSSNHPNLKDDVNTEITESVPKSVSFAEEILLASLTGPTLGKFPKNLKYLADFDRVSPPESDLIVYMDKMATYLAEIHHVESQIDPENWQVLEGFTNGFGKIALNDEHEKSIGVFLQFWQNNRFYNRQLKKNSPEAFLETPFKALLAIEESEVAAVDILAEASRQPWVLQNFANEQTQYYFRGKSDTAHLHNQQSVIANAKWKLVLRFTEPLSLPVTLLDYFGISDYEQAKSQDTDRLWKAASETGELSFKNNGTIVSFLFDESPTFVSLQAVSIADLHVLSELVPALRNQLVLTNLIKNVAFAENSESLASSESCKIDEAKKKIRDSLQLSSDVPDDELLALNTMSSDYMGVQLGRNPDLADFMKGANEEGDDMETDELEATPEQQETPFLAIAFQEINYGSLHSDYVLQIEGNAAGFNAENSAVKMRIENGRILADKTAEDVDMDVETGRLGEEFVRSLGLGEDVLLALEAMKD